MPELDVAPPDVAYFLREHVAANAPLLVRGGAAHWPALACPRACWTRERLLRAVGNAEVSVDVTPNGRADAVTQCAAAPGGWVFATPATRQMRFATFDQLLRSRAGSEDEVVYLQVRCHWLYSPPLLRCCPHTPLITISSWGTEQSLGRRRQLQPCWLQQPPQARPLLNSHRSSRTATSRESCHSLCKTWSRSCPGLLQRLVHRRKPQTYGLGMSEGTRRAVLQQLLPLLFIAMFANFSTLRSSQL